MNTAEIIPVSRLWIWIHGWKSHKTILGVACYGSYLLINDLAESLGSAKCCRVGNMNQLRNRIIMELGHTSYKLSQVLPDLAFREKSLSSSPKAPDLLTFGLEWDPGSTWGDFLFWLSRICRRIPTRSSSTWWFKATDVSIYLQQWVSANFLASVMMIIEHCE